MQSPRTTPNLGILALASSFAHAGNGRQLQSIFQFFTLLLDMLMQPKFATQYYTLTQVFTNVVTSWLAITITGGLSWALDVFYFKGTGQMTLVSTCVLHMGLLILIGYHAYRLGRLYIDQDLESDSESDGPPLRIFRWFPNGDHWGYTRMFWQPLIASVAFTIPALLGIIPLLFPLYIYMCSFALFMRALATWHEGWCYSRSVRDQNHRAAIIQGIADGAVPPTTIGRIALCGVSDATPPQQRKTIYMDMAGLTPEMQAMLSPVDKAA